MNEDTAQPTARHRRQLRRRGRTSAAATRWTHRPAIGSVRDGELVPNRGPGETRTVPGLGAYLRSRCAGVGPIVGCYDQEMKSELLGGRSRATTAEVRTLPDLDVVNRIPKQHCYRDWDRPRLVPCVCQGGDVSTYGWESEWEFVIQNWTPQDRRRQRNHSTRVHVYQSILLDTYMYDSNLECCGRDVRNAKELFGVQLNGVVPMPDVHGVIIQRLGPTCDENCLMVTFVSGDAELVTIQTASPDPVAPRYELRRDRHRTYDKHGSQTGDRESVTGAAAYTYANVGKSRVRYDYSAEVTHCGPGGTVITSRQQVPPAAGDVNTNPFPIPGTGPYKPGQRLKYLRGRKIRWV